MKKLVQLVILFFVLCVGTGFDHTSEAAARKKVKLNKTKLSLTAGKTYTLKLKNNKKKVKWSSSKKTVASVTAKGKVKAKKAGKAVITAKAAGKKYKCRVTVKAKNPTVSQESRDFTKTLQQPVYQENFTKLKNQIQQYGVMNSSGNKFFSGSLTYKTMEINYGIVYDATNQRFDFILTSYSLLDDDSAALGALTLSVTEASITSGNISYKIVYEAGYYGSVSSISLLSDIHSENNTLLWNLEESNLEDTPNLANLSLDLGYVCWEKLLTEQNLGLSMVELGFGA